MTRERMPERVERRAAMPGRERIVGAWPTRKTAVMTHLGYSRCVLRCVVRYISKDSLSNYVFASAGTTTVACDLQWMRIPCAGAFPLTRPRACYAFDGELLRTCAGKKWRFGDCANPQAVT